MSKSFSFKTTSGGTVSSSVASVVSSLSSAVVSPSARVSSEEGWVSSYNKFRLRKAVDFALSAVAVNVKMEEGRIADIRIAFGGVAPTAFRAKEVEELLKGQIPTEELAVAAGNLAVKNAIPMKDNEYKVEILRFMVKEMVLGLR